MRKFLDDCRFWRSGEPILGLTGLNDINSVTTCPLCQAACVGILTMSNQYSHSALNIPVFPSKFHSHSHFAPYKQARAPDSHACLLVAWIPWKHSVISCTPSIHVVHIRCPLSALSFCASGTRRSFLTRTAACHISLVHTKSLSSLVVRRSSVMAFALAVSAIQVSMVDLWLCCVHHSRTLSRASSHFTAFCSSASFSSRSFLLSRHRSFLTLLIVSSESINTLR